MKLYATTTSERASKGQGGNKFLCIEVQNEKKEVICEINCMPSFLTIRSFETEGLYIDYSELKLKGKSQKGENYMFENVEKTIKRIKDNPIDSRYD